VDYKNLIYGDFGMLLNDDNKFASIGISANLETLCGEIGLKYKLPLPLALGITVGRALYQDKTTVVYYLGIVGEFDK